MKNKKINQLIIGAILIMSFGFSQEWTFGSEVRYRHEAINKDFSDTSGFNSLNYQRTRFQAQYEKKKARIFLQLQDSRIMGTESNTLTDGSADALDMHQAYFLLSNEGTFQLKVGRYEVNYGSQRILGAVGWHNIGRSFDGITLSHQLTNGTSVDFFNLKLVENYPNSGRDKDDQNLRGFNVRFSDRLPFLKEGLFVQDNNRMTTLFTLKKEMKRFQLSGEIGYQTGKMDTRSLSAWLLSLKGSYTINSVTFHTGIDALSGDDTATAADESFNTLFATNHKFYGHMDYFLNLPVHTKGLGLLDFYVQSTTKILGWNVNTIVHHFRSQQENSAGLNTFGTEIDNNISFPIFQSAKAIFGHSLFFPGDIMAPKGDPAQWYYVTASIKI